MGAKKIKGAKPVPLFEGLVEPVSLRDRLQSWLETHVQAVVGGVVVLVLIAATAWGIDTYRTSREKKAEAEYTRLLNAWLSPTGPKENETFVEATGKFIREFGGTHAALNATLDLARAAFELKKYDDAVMYSKEVLDRAPSGVSLKMLARYQLALALDASGQADQAVEHWTALKNEVHSGLVREALWRLARYHAAKGDVPKAIQLYEEALQATAAYPPNALLESELTALRIKGGSNG